MTYKLVGQEPYQLPSNADLGTMAYQNSDGINIGLINVGNTASIAGLVAPLTIGYSQSSAGTVLYLTQVPANLSTGGLIIGSNIAANTTVTSFVAGFSTYQPTYTATTASTLVALTSTYGLSTSFGVGGTGITYGTLVSSISNTGLPVTYNSTGSSIGTNTLYIGTTTNVAVNQIVIGSGVVTGTYVTGITANISVTISNTSTNVSTGTALTFVPTVTLSSAIAANTQTQNLLFFPTVTLNQNSSAAVNQGTVVNNYFAPTSAGNAALVIQQGGIGVTGNSYFANSLNIAASTNSGSTTTGALTVTGGAGIGGNLTVGGTISGTFSGSITTASNIASGTPGQLHYQSSPGITSFVSTGTAGNILVSNGINAPTYNNTLTLSGTTSATSTNSGALQVVGGVGIGGDLYSGNHYIQRTNISASSDTVAAWVYDSTSTYTSTVTNQDIFFKPDGTKMFGISTNAIFQWTLGTPWTLTGSVTSGTTYSLAAVDTAVAGITFSPDGTSMVTVGNTAVANATVGSAASEDRAYYFTLATPWDPSSATLVSSIRFAIGDQGIPAAEATPTACAYDNTGGNFYVIGTTVRRVYQYTLSTPYVVNTSTVVYSRQYITAEDTSPQGLSFNNNGTRMYILGATNDSVSEYRLSTPWDVTTAVYYDKFFVGLQNGSMLGLYINNTATNYAFMVGSTAIYRYSTNTQASFVNPETSASNIILNGLVRVKGATNILYTDYDIYAGRNITTYNNTINVGQSGAAASLFTGLSTGALSFYTGQSSGALSVGGTAATGNITIGQSTAAQAVGIASGATASASTKTVNIGTNGTTGSTTNINIGPVLGSGTTTVNNGITLGSTSNNPILMSGNYTQSTPGFIVATGTLVGTTTTNNIYAFNYQHTLAPVSTATIANYYGQLFLPTLTNTATYGTMYGAFARIDMSAAATSGTVTSWYGFSSENPGRNAAADVRFTNHFGFRASDPSSITATNVYGFASQIPATSGVNKWNIYSSGTAPNYFSGSVGINTTVFNYGEKLAVNGGQTISGIFTSTNTTDSQSTNSGALQVVGGVGIGGSLFVGGTVTSTNHIVTGSANASSTNSGALQVIGGAGINGGLFVGGIVTATAFVGALTGTATTATNIAGGATGSILMQTAAGATAFIPLGTNGYVLTAGINTATWQAVSGLSAGTSTNANNVLTTQQISAGSYYPVFVSANNATGVYMPEYTTSTFLVNPGTQVVTVQNLQAQGTATVLSTLASTGSVQNNALYVAGGVGIGQSLYVTGPAVFNNSVTFSGTTTYVLSTNTVYTDNILELHYPSTGTVWTVDDGKDIGLRFHYYSAGDQNAALVLANDSKYLEWYGSGIEDSTSTIKGSYGTFKTGGIILTSTASSTSTLTGALTVAGGVGIGGNLYAANIYTNGSQLLPTTIQTFISSANSTTFAISGGYVVGQQQVFVNGISLSATAGDYTANGSTIVLSTPRNSGDVVQVVSQQGYAVSAQRAYIFNQYTSNGTTTTFATNYNTATVQVFQNGILQMPTTYSATNGTSIIFGSIPSNGTVIGVVSFNSVSIANAISSSGGTINGTLNVTGNLQVSGVNVKSYATAMAVAMAM